jgi:hypothetical protein
MSERAFVAIVIKTRDQVIAWLALENDRQCLRPCVQHGIDRLMVSRAARRVGREKKIDSPEPTRQRRRASVECH